MLGSVGYWTEGGFSLQRLRFRSAVPQLRGRASWYFPVWFFSFPTPRSYHSSITFALRFCSAFFVLRFWTTDWGRKLGLLGKWQDFYSGYGSGPLCLSFEAAKLGADRGVVGCSGHVLASFVSGFLLLPTSLQVQRQLPQPPNGPFTIHRLLTPTSV